jgi:hypothetical protein
MTRPCRGATVGLLVLLGAVTAGVLAPAGDGVKEKKAVPGEALEEPGGTIKAAGMAATEPDEYAWRLFLFINRQAKAECAGVADPKKKTIRDYDPDTDVVWESWALASSAASEVFLANAAKPVAWDRLRHPQRPPPAAKLDVNVLLARQRLLSLDVPALRSEQPLRKLLDLLPEEVEVRMNRATFDPIRDNGWYSRDGLVAAYEKAKAANNPDFIQLPPAAKVVKAAWRLIGDARKQDYHWRTIGGKTYGLMALHVMTKDLPLWFWCDFIHADLEASEPTRPRDTTTRGPDAKHGTAGVRDETRGSKWASYRLKGTQTAFTDARGKGTDLGNQVLEGNNVKISSCVTCHATAVIDEKGTRPVFSFFLGVPPTTGFAPPSGTPLLQTDFLWSLAFRAVPTGPTPE